MTRPMGEPTAGRRTAVSQAAIRQLQRRPAPTMEAAGGVLQWASAWGIDAFPDKGAYYDIYWNNVYTSPAATAFSTATGNGSAGSTVQWIELLEPGAYLVKVNATAGGGGTFSNANGMFLEVAFELGGNLASYPNNSGNWDWQIRFTKADQLLPTHQQPASLHTEQFISWNPDSPSSDADFENPLRIGADLAWAGGPGTQSMIVNILVLKLPVDAGRTTIF